MIFLKPLRYIEYILFSRHRRGHGIHSPFAFDLVTRVFRNKTDKIVVLTIESLRKKNLSDPRKINVSDLGAGSLRMKTSIRKVSEIARYSAIPGKYGRLLSNLSAEFGNTSVIELGTSLGISTMYLAAGSPGKVVYTIEGCPETSSVADENFRNGGFSNITLMNGSFDEMLQVLKQQNIKPGLVFIDGNHKKEPTCNYYRIIKEMSDNQVVIVIDDIHYSKGMEDAWNAIRNDVDVTLSVDLFRFGLIFLRKGLIPQSYTIWY